MLWTGNLDIVVDDWCVKRTSLKKECDHSKPRTQLEQNVQSMQLGWPVIQHPTTVPGCYQERHDNNNNNNCINNKIAIPKLLLPLVCHLMVWWSVHWLWQHTVTVFARLEHHGKLFVKFPLLLRQEFLDHFTFFHFTTVCCILQH